MHTHATLAAKGISLLYKVPVGDALRATYIVYASIEWQMYIDDDYKYSTHSVRKDFFDYDS